MTDDELNAAAAVEVMGWKRYRFVPKLKKRADNRSWIDHSDPEKMTGMWWDEEGEIVECGDDVPLYDNVLKRIPKPATEIADAFALVAKLSESGWRMQLSCMTTTSVELWLEGGSYPSVSFCDDSACRAITRAAIAAARAGKAQDDLS